jgi:small-conductance mechanosensitive channel
VSGLYVLAARPFRVGDYVRIGSVEGIVNEITLNYTRVLQPDETSQLVPNSKVLSSEVTNFRIRISDYIKEKEKEAEQTGDRSIKRSLRSMIHELRTLTGYDDAYRYTFDISIHMSFNHKEVLELFDEMCEKWTKTFLAKPTYFVWAKPAAAITYRFAFITEDPMVIVKKGADFMMDLLQVYYTPH